MKRDPPWNSANHSNQTRCLTTALLHRSAEGSIHNEGPIQSKVWLHLPVVLEEKRHRFRTEITLRAGRPTGSGVGVNGLNNRRAVGKVPEANVAVEGPCTAEEIVVVLLGAEFEPKL